MNPIIEPIIYHFSYELLYALAFGYFLFLYFGLGQLFLFCCKKLESLKIVHKIVSQGLKKNQIRFEITHSLKSIAIFGFSIIPIIYLIRQGQINLLPDTWTNILIGVVALTIWNEIHFYVVHRFLHQKWMMRNIHKVHHQSTTPTVYSVYSFYWLEALLLSTTPLTFIPFFPTSVVAVFLYPMVSILLNFAGHCNYRFGNGVGQNWWLFGTFHNEHHSRGRKNFGFALNILDRFFSKENK